MEVLHSALGPASHASVFGASPCSGSLVLLGGCGPGPSALFPLGHVMPAPWSPSKTQAARQTLRWTVGSQATPVSPGPQCEMWAALLPQLRNTAEGPRPQPLLVLLVPLALGDQLVGALLCAQPQQPSGDDDSRELHLWASPGAVAAVSAVLVDCLLAPNMRIVRQVCSAAQTIINAPDIRTIASVLSTTVAVALSAELHVDMAVRLALVPPPPGAAAAAALQYGFMMQLRGPSASNQPPFHQSQMHSSNDAVPVHGQATVGLSSSFHAADRGGDLGSLLERGASATSHVIVAERTDSVTGRVQEPKAALSGVLNAQITGTRCGQEPRAPEAGGGSFLLACMEEVRPSEPGAEDLLPTSRSVGGGGGAPSETNQGARSWKAVPFALATSLLGGLLRDEGPLQSLVSYGYGKPRNSTSTTTFASKVVQRTHSSSMAAAGLGARPSVGGASSDGRSRVTGLVVPDLHLYLQDIDRPSGDVFLLFGSKRGGGGGGGAGGTPTAGGAGGATSSPMCLVLLAACGVSCAGGGASVSGVNALMRGVSNVTDTRLASTPECVGAGGECSSNPSLALFMTSHDKLPASLLRAARDFGHGLLEVLLPAALDCLTNGPAASELEDMALLMETRVTQGSTSGLARKDFPRSWLASSSVTGQPRTVLQTPIHHQQPTSAPSPQNCSSATNVTNPSPTASPYTAVALAVEAAAAAAGVRAVNPTIPRPLPLTRRLPLRRGSSRNSMLSRLPVSTSASAGDSRNGRALEAHYSSGCARRMPAELMVPVLSPLTTGANRPLLSSSSAATDFSNLPSAAGLRLRATAATSVGGRPPRGVRRFTTDLLDLERVGGDGLGSDLPPLNVLLASLYSTLNETESDPSPYANDDLRFLRLTRLIGEGGCSVVYAGRLLGLEVAVKLLDPLTEDDPEDAPASFQAAPDSFQNGLASKTDRKGWLSDTQGSLGPGEEEGQVAKGPRGPLTSGQKPFGAATRQARLRDLMRGARELAVMTSISHPNIVQVYSYHTHVTVVQQLDGKAGDLPRLLPMGSEESPAECGAPRMTIIMEYCDLGSLADALDSGRFKEAIMRAATAAGIAAHGYRRSNSGVERGYIARSVQRPGGSATSQGTGGVAMRAIYLTLLEVALALRHLHSKSLAHCDVKAANVLLKSSISDSRGFTCKLADFGLVGMIRKEAPEGGQQPSAADAPVGTVTHLAPEYFTQGTKLDYSIDMYAFGIVMWEVFTSKPPFLEHSAQNFQDLPYLVAVEGLRPRWPAHTPPAYRTLANACWAPEPSERPSAATVVTALQRLMEGGG